MKLVCIVCIVCTVCIACVVCIVVRQIPFPCENPTMKIKSVYCSQKSIEKPEPEPGTRTSPPLREPDPRPSPLSTLKSGVQASRTSIMRFRRRFHQLRLHEDNLAAARDTTEMRRTAEARQPVTKPGHSRDGAVTEPCKPVTNWHLSRLCTGLHGFARVCFNIFYWIAGFNSRRAALTRLDIAAPEVHLRRGIGGTGRTRSAVLTAGAFLMVESGCNKPEFPLR